MVAPVPRFVQLRCGGETFDGTKVTKEAMKAKIFLRSGTVVLFKGRGHGIKGALAGIYNSIPELAALELAARMAREKLIELQAQS